MRKWTYLVAALLMGGATATFTGCIDTDEPAGINELRGAKAELLRAKAAVETAEAAIKTAQAAWVQAKADYEAQKAAQEELATALQQAINAAKQDSIQRQMEINSAEMDELLAQAQQAAAKAQSDYEKALIDIQVAMVGYEENAYATELMRVLTSRTYTVDWIDYSTTPATPQSQTMYGLNGINSTIRTANNDLAEMMRELSKLQFSYDISSKIAAVEGQLAIEQGELEGLKANLEDLKVIAGKPYEEWDAQYQEFEAEKEDLEAQKAQLDAAKAEALRPVVAEEKANTEAGDAKSELAFEIPEAIQNDFAEVLNDAFTSGPVPFGAWRIEDADGNITFPSGVKASLTMAEKADTLNGIINELKQNWVLDAQKLAAEQAKLTQQKATNDIYWTATTGTYHVDLAAWQAALTAYQTAYNAGNYADQANNARANVIAAYKQFILDVNNPEIVKDQATKTPVVQAFLTTLNTYLTNRKALDGFEPATAPTFNNLNDGSWYASLDVDTNAENYFGSDIAAGTILNGGLYQDYVDAATKLGYNSDINPKDARLTEYTYEEYAENNYSYSGELTAGSTAAAAFTARHAYEETDSKVTNKADWDELYAALVELNDANTEALNELSLAKAETASKRAAIEAEYDAKGVEFDVQMAGLDAIMIQIQTVLTNAGAAGADYDAILQDLKDQIAQLESGTVSNTGDDYTFTNPTGSIPGQEVVVAEYEKLLAALQDGSYEPMEAALITQKEAEIAGQEAYIEALNAVFEAVSAKKDTLLAALTGGSAETPAE